MVKVYAIDRDGTLETGEPPGPLKICQVLKLLKQGHILYSYGNYKLIEELPIPYAPGRDKWQRLKWIMERHPDAEEYIYIDDVDQKMPGWKWLKPEEAARMIGPCPHEERAL
ncbi:hypothetical protein [Alphaspiravirus yamagawaense]|uniref:Uncharacterized protein n=1 Tax=Alphaspiravirus yamagawaense TaxID=1157339 RepID=J7Q7K5_9VIRU|nr:hypothetical protein [Aeropyrum coil-shaped virus]CCG27862.1 hypothetical protein [Aeropyrum coil-shaped virus]